MKLSLFNLYKSMIKQDIERYKFNFKFNQFNFEAIYFIGEEPHVLSFGIINHNFYFESCVEKEFRIRPYINNLNKFCEIMGFEYNKENPFHPSKFFSSFDGQLPSLADNKGIPKPSKVALHRKNVMESDEIYFVGWLDNNKAGRNVHSENLEKTRRLLSYEAYTRCKEKNISSRWSPYPSDENKYYLPSS